MSFGFCTLIFLIFSLQLTKSFRSLIDVYGSEDEYLGPEEPVQSRILAGSSSGILSDAEAAANEDEFGPGALEGEGEDDDLPISIAEMQKRSLQQKRTERRRESQMTEEEKNLRELFQEFDLDLGADVDAMDVEGEEREEEEEKANGGLWSWINGVSDRAKGLWDRVSADR